jgi:hypothetical protein
MGTATFWSSVDLDPKRQYRFQVNIGELAPFIVKTAKKPSFVIGVSKHQYLNHEFKFPTNVKWNDVTITFVDPGAPDTANEFVKRLIASGYTNPKEGGADNIKTLSKQKASGAVGNVVIKQINAEGVTVEEWTLYNAFISTAEFGELSYASEDMVQISVTFVYDWATLK